MPLSIVELIDRLVRAEYGIDAVKARTPEVFTEGHEPGVVYRFDVQGVRYFLACGLMQPTGDTAEAPMMALLAEVYLFEMPGAWSIILDLLDRRFPDAGGMQLAVLDEGRSLGLDLLLPLAGCSPCEIETKLAGFLRCIEPTCAAILALYPDLSVPCGGT